ncbi:gfo/Idh/MocA family oxidoreductase [Thermoplasma sp. Kam2015]|uniref:Gfo/Idh/MocA family protein n=1 Tax=Thermoplasma sp. Kam2015 TaxID=2094122 RepID=UPI000D936FB0|nr:Gfo/Idh/MocA family oxidoreductase [Thermoplasma sp. Kam2015]PYB68916.1 gfo/Idh/MocA family oxidoreductase [Thermoplasma sp. Kam2015]
MDIVLVGCRGFGKEHLRIYSKLGYDVAIVERDPEEARRCMEQFRISKVYENYEDALRSNADIIDLVVPDGLHYEMGTLAIRAKKNLLVEKPITPDIDSGISLIQQANESKLKFMVAEQFYFDPSVAEALRRIKNGEIGTPHTVIVRHQSYRKLEGWRNEKGMVGRGILIDEGTHYIDTLLNFGGNFRSLRSFVHRTWDYVGEDTAEAVFNFENGMHGIFFYSWNYPEYPLIPEFEIIGDNGSIYEDVGTKPLEPWTQRKRKTAYGDIIVNGKHIPVETYDVIEKEIGGFLESVEKDEPVPMPPEIALRDIITIDRIYKASSD